MNLCDLFPANDHHSWQTTHIGYRPNSGLSAQTCQACGALVEYALRQLHHEWHELIAQATATS